MSFNEFDIKTMGRQNDLPRGVSFFYKAFKKLFHTASYARLLLIRGDNLGLKKF